MASPESANGRDGEWARRRMGETANGRVGETATGRIGERAVVGEVGLGQDRGRDKGKPCPSLRTDWQISCIRLSSWWLTFKKIGKPQHTLVLRKTSQPRRSRYLAIGIDRPL
jgi:hypothetical protein